MLPDFENAMKWLRWIKAKPLYKAWLISPLVLLVIMIWLWGQNGKLKDQVTPIRELYPKLELSAAVARLIEDHNQLKEEIELAKRKAQQKRFVPFAEHVSGVFRRHAQKLLEAYPQLDFKVKVLCNSPSSDQFKKAREIVQLFRKAAIDADYSNTTMASTHDWYVKCSPALPEDARHQIARLLNTLSATPCRLVLRDSAEADTDGNIDIYSLGTPSFDAQGRIFYEPDAF